MFNRDWGTFNWELLATIFVIFFTIGIFYYFESIKQAEFEEFKKSHGCAINQHPLIIEKDYEIDSNGNLIKIYPPDTSHRGKTAWICRGGLTFWR